MIALSEAERNHSPAGALRAHGTIAERLAEYAARLGGDASAVTELLRPVRHRTRPDRDAPMYLPWRGPFPPGPDRPAFRRELRRRLLSLPPGRKTLEDTPQIPAHA